jgi:NAD(P)-dependent dehydrogenase (short-subunit alcohol dehydrogenase family)
MVTARRKKKVLGQDGLRGRVALITGATRGIGLAIARALAHQGCNLVVTGRDQAALTRVSRELSRSRIRVISQACDSRDPHSVELLFASVRKEFKRLDILINNAGISHQSLPVEKLPFSEWKEVIDTNLHGMFLVTQAALAIMEPGGTIVNMLSVAANRVFAGGAGYGASKHAALGLTNILREELRPRGIRVIGILPGATNTDIWNSFWAAAPREKMMSADTVAEIVTQAILLPDNATVETLEIRPTVGAL